MYSNTNRLKKFVGFMIVAVTMLIIPQSVKAATPITGGDSKENATEITHGVDYISTNMEGYYKITLPSNTYCVGVGYDEYSTVYHSIDTIYSGVEETSCIINNYAKGDMVYVESIPSQYLSEGQEIIFRIYTSKAESCSFKVILGTAYGKTVAPTIDLNKDYSLSVPFGNSWTPSCYYKFVAPYSGKYKASVEYNTILPQDIWIAYKDGTEVQSQWSTVNNRFGYCTFNVTQGMTYYVVLPLKSAGNMTFSVSNTKVSSITLNTTQLSMNRNDQYLLEAVALPENAVDRTVSFSSSNPDVASVSEEGWITAKSVGSANITVTANDGSGVVATCAVTVNPVAVQKITLAQSSKSFDFWDVYYSDGEYDEEIQIYVDTIEPADADNKAVVFASSNPSVAEVDNEGNLTLKSAGTTVITCSAADGFGASATCTVSVTKGLDRGSKFSVDNISYKVTSYPIDTVKTVSVYGVKNKNASKYTIPSTVSTNGEIFKVTEIGSKAFYNCKKAKTIQIGKNITKIGKKSFANCKALKKLEVKSTRISSVAKDSLTGINKNAQIIVPASKYKKYQKLFADKGQKSSVKIKK